MTYLESLQSSYAWLDLRGRTGQAILDRPVFLHPGIFKSEAHFNQNIVVAFNQKSILIPMDDHALIASVAIKTQQEDVMSISFPFSSGGIIPIVENGQWHIPVGCLVVRANPRDEGISGAWREGRGFSFSRSQGKAPRGWKRREFIYCNPETVFMPSAILYWDHNDDPCFAEEFNPYGEAIAADRYALFL